LIQYRNNLNSLIACCRKSYINGSVGFRVWCCTPTVWCCRRRAYTIVFFLHTTPRPSCTTHELTPSVVTRTADYCRWAGSCDYVAGRTDKCIADHKFRSVHPPLGSCFHCSALFSFHRDPTRVFRPTQSCPHRSSDCRFPAFILQRFGWPCISVLTS